MKYFKNVDNKPYAFDDDADSSLIPDNLIEIDDVEFQQLVEDTNQSLVNDPRRIRDEALAALVHDFGDGRVIQCRPHPFSDESNMRNAIEQMGRLNQTERLWFGADNTAVTVTAADLRTVIESGQDQSAVVWTDFFTSISG